MLTTPSFYKFRNSEFIQYLTDVKKIASQCDPNALQVGSSIAILNEQTIAMDSVYKKQLGSTITNELEILDKRRDLAIIGLRAVVEGHTYHFDPAKKNAAKELLQSIDQYGRVIARQNYQAQTTTLRNLTEDWQKNLILKAALATLGLNDWTHELKESNNYFNAKYLERNTEYAEASKINVTQLRDQARKSYEQLINLITAHQTLNPSEIYATIVKEINALTEQYNNMVQKRKAIDTEIEEEVITH